MKISEIITLWYKKNKRNLPWRETTNPYYVWLSEIMLQQTQVKQGLPYYLKFKEAYPDIISLASENEEAIMKLWQGLGYYSRARNMHFAARQVLDEFDAVFPSRYSDLLKLKGVGPYTAAAIASICYGEAIPVVDGNVARVLSRLFTVEEPVNTPAGERIIYRYANELLDKTDPGNFNQALMEFGALQCVPQNPDCNVCPLNNICEAFQEGAQKLFPKKKKARPAINRFFTFLILDKEGSTYIYKRSGKDIWQNMYHFPLIETESQPSLEDLPALAEGYMAVEASSIRIRHVSETLKHQLSHQTLYARFLHLELHLKDFQAPEEWKKLRIEEVNDYPLPRLIDRYLEFYY